MLQDVFFFPQSYPSPFSLTFLFWFKCFFYTHYRFHRRQYVWDLIENHDVLSCVCSGIQSHHIEYESVFHIFHTCNDSSSHNRMSHSLLCTQSRHCLYLLPHISQPNHLFQLPVYCCRSDCNFTVFEVFSDFLYSNMLSLHGLQKSMLLSHLFYLISGFCHFDLSFSIWKSFLNYLHQPRILFCPHRSICTP